MTIDDKLKKAGLTVPNLEDLYRTERLRRALHLSLPGAEPPLSLGTTPRKDGQGYLPGVVGKTSRWPGLRGCSYAALTTVAPSSTPRRPRARATDRHMIGFVNSAPGFSDQPRVINGPLISSSSCWRAAQADPRRIGCQGSAATRRSIIATVLFTGADVRPPLARDHFQK